MNIQALKLIFERSEVPDYYYVFGGLGGGDCFGLEETVTGWDVYYSESGKKLLIGRFSTESAACDVLLAEVDRRLLGEEGRKLKV